MRALAVTMMLLPSVVFAQNAAPPPIAPIAPIAPAADAADQGECTVTTTVRCTGAAAPYAVQAAQPQAPVVIQAPPPAPPPPPQIVLDPRRLGGDGWRVVQSQDGCLWRERKISTDSPTVWGTGLALFAGGFAVGAIGGTAVGGVDLFAWWPIIGPFANAAFNSGSAQVLWAVDGVVQVGGFVTFLVGLAAGPDKMERVPLSVGPVSFVGGGSGVALAGRF